MPIESTVRGTSGRMDNETVFVLGLSSTRNRLISYIGLVAMGWPGVYCVKDTIQ